MESFEELGLTPSLVEALAAEGIELPTTLQAHAIPVLRRGNSAVLRGGPGSGVLVAYGAPLLDRLEPESGYPRAIVLVGGREQARHLAISLARLAMGTGHRIGALGVPWALPERADILFSTPVDLERGIGRAEVKIEHVVSFVLDGASELLEADGVDRIATLLRGVDGEGLQIALVGDPLTPAVRQFVDAHLKRAVFLPPESHATEDPPPGIQRGTLRVRTVEGEKEREVPKLIAELLEGDAAHVLAFFRSEDRAADIGDLLALHGFLPGAPGDPEAPVWLGVIAMEARRALRERDEQAEPVVTVSVDVPADIDELDRRHGGSRPDAPAAVVLAHPRELPHLRRSAREAGYTLVPFPAGDSGATKERSLFLQRLEQVLDEEDLVPPLLLLEPLLARRSAAEVAAALALLLRRSPRSGDGPEKAEPEQPAGAAARPPAWVRLFLSVGERDGVGAGDLLGAMIGETGIAGDQVGRIDLRDTFSRVEVQEAVAERVIRSLNGTSIRGRSVRVDYDRGEGRARREGAGARSSRREGGRGKGAPRPKGG